MSLIDTSTTTPTPPTVGIDWACDDHAVSVVDPYGGQAHRFVIAHTGPDLARLPKRLRALGVAEVAIERPDGPVVDALLNGA